MTRRGHGRPLGTTTRVRMDWRSDGDPRLEDVTREEDSDRWYLVVGIEEHRDSPRVWWLTLERIGEDAADLLVLAGARFWGHERYRRPPAAS